jgi:hypothetical protein
MSSVCADGSRSRAAARVMAGSGAPSATSSPVASSIRAAASAGSSVAGSRFAAAGSRSARGTRWSLTSLNGTPRTPPPAGGRNRTPTMTVPALLVLRAGPVSGPAT